MKTGHVEKLALDLRHSPLRNQFELGTINNISTGLECTRCVQSYKAVSFKVWSITCTPRTFSWTGEEAE